MCSMSVGIVRVQKMTIGSVKGIEIHDRREKDISHTNKDINWEHTHQNYDLNQKQNHNFYQAVKNKIGKLNLPKAVRKDAVVMAQVLVTSDHDFFENLSHDQQRQFFKDSYQFLVSRYGQENVISAIVHLDERTPHMHFNFVPVTADGRLSAKSVLTRQSLVEQQTAFYEQVGKKYGLNRGQTKAERIEQGNYRKNMTMPEFKAYTAQLGSLKEQVATLTKTEQRARESVSKAQEHIQEIQNSIKPLQAVYDALKAYIRACDVSSNVSVLYPDYVQQANQNGTQVVIVPKDKWEQKHISANEKQYLEAAMSNFEKAMLDFYSSSSAKRFVELENKVIDLEHKTMNLKKENKSLSDEVVTMKESYILAEQARIAFAEKISQVVLNLSPRSKTEFWEMWNFFDPKNLSEDIGFDR